MDKIICLGKNYLDHAKELGDAIPEKPVLFLKPPSSLVAQQNPNQNINVPWIDWGSQLHHECEAVARICKDGFRMNLTEAQQSFDALTLGLDMTLRDVQNNLKKNGHPWEMSKAFPNSAIIGTWFSKEQFPSWETEEFSLEVAGNIRQKAKASQMRMNIAQAIAYASEHFALKQGDLLFTGTPAGVAEIKSGDHAILRWGPIHYSVTWK